MSTETANVVSLPTAEDNQQHEKIVKEEDHAVEQGDAPPSKNDAEKHEKDSCEAENIDGSETSVTKSEETQVINQVEPPVLEIEKADHIPVQNVEADHQCQPLEVVENVPQAEKPTVEVVEKEVEKIQTIEATENEESEKPQTTESVVENEPEKTEPIEDDKNKPVGEIAIETVDKEADKLPVEKVAIEAVENEPETQGGEACEKKQDTKACEDKAVEKIATENEQETQATEACEDKAVEKIIIEAVDKKSEKTQAIEADENKQEEAPAIEEQKDENAKVGAVESNPSSELVTPAEENVEGEKETITDEGKTACELTMNVEAQTVEKEAGVVDKVKEDSTNELKNATDQVIEKPVEGEQKSDRELVEGLVKEDEYKDIKVNGEEAKNDSKTDATLTVESCKDGDHETQASKDQVQDVSAKPAQKQSGNNIISKVKQSLVKVKKAIIGKSPSSKVLSPEIKGDQENVK